MIQVSQCGSGFAGAVITDICLPMGPDGVWAYPFSPVVADQDFHWNMFLKMEGAPNYWASATGADAESANVEYEQACSNPESYTSTVAEFMCFDKWMQERFKLCATEAGHPEW